MKIERIFVEVAENLCCNLTADLPEYFGLPECNEQYALGIRTRTNFAVKIEEKYVGLLSLEFPYPNNGNIYWMAILRDYQNLGLGKKLVEAASSYAQEKGAETLSVETLAPENIDENYLKTYEFYKACGFKPLFNLKPQNYEWNMVYMVKNII